MNDVYNVCRVCSTCSNMAMADYKPRLTSSLSPADPLAVHYQLCRACVPPTGLCDPHPGQPLPPSLPSQLTVLPPSLPSQLTVLLSSQLRVLRNDFARYNVVDDESDQLDQVPVLLAM